MSARRRFALAGAVGALAGAVVFAWLLTAGTWRLFDWHASADLYDAQAESLLDGRLDIPRSILGIEAFEHDGRSYMYQGPFPALLRLPVAAVTDSFAGRLAALSMLAAFVTAAAAVVALAWQLRVLVRGDAPVGPLETAAVAGFSLAATAGSAVLAVGSQVTVYHEGALWGVATGLVGFALLLRHLLAPRWWVLAATAVAATACLWSRASIGIGVAGALVLVFLGELLRWMRLRRARTPWRVAEALAPRGSGSGRGVVAALAASLVPVVLFSGLNLAKFGEPVDVPWDRQAFVKVSDDRAEFLDAHGGTFFGPVFVPSTLLAYLRPDGARLDARFPWVGFRTDDIGRRELVGGVLFDRVDATGTIPTSFPLLVVLGVVGLVAVLRGRRGLASVWVPLLGAAAAAASIFAFGYIALRYLADVVPLLVLLGATGLAVVGDWSARRTSRPRRAATGVGLALLAAAGLWINLGQGLWYQRVYASPADEPSTGRFFERRRNLFELGAGAEPAVSAGDALPPRGRPGELRVVGDCDGLYVSDGATLDRLSHTNWKAVARTPRVGAYDLDLRFRGTRGPLLIAGDTTLAVEGAGGRRVRFAIRGAEPGTGPAVEIDPDRWYRVRASLDPHTDFALVTLGDRTVLSGAFAGEEVARLAWPAPDVRRRPADRSLCEELLSGRAGARRGTGTRTARG